MSPPSVQGCPKGFEHRAQQNRAFFVALFSVMPSSSATCAAGSPSTPNRWKACHAPEPPLDHRQIDPLRPAPIRRYRGGGLEPLNQALILDRVLIQPGVFVVARQGTACWPSRLASRNLQFICPAGAANGNFLIRNTTPATREAPPNRNRNGSARSLAMTDPRG